MASSSVTSSDDWVATVRDAPNVLRILRVAAAVAAAAGLLLNGLNLRRLVGFWTSGLTESGAAVAGWRLLPAVLQALAFGIGFALLALVIIWRVRDRHEVLVGALFAASYSLSGGVSHAGPLSSETWFPVAFVFAGALARATGVRFAALFPRPLRREDVMAVAPGWARRSVAPVLAALLDPRVYWPIAVAFEAIMGVLPQDPVRSNVHILIWSVLASVYLYTSYRRGSDEERQRVFWILEGVVLFVAAETMILVLWAANRGGVLSLDPGLWTGWVVAITLWAVLACFYFAVFGAGALDSSLILRRTTVISVSSAVVVLIFITLETLTEQVVAQVLGLQSGAGAIVAGVVAAATFHPLSRWIDRHVHRWGVTAELARSRGGSTGPR